MASNPFFSGRIPPSLNEHVNQHVTKTGETKTQVLIKALAAYLDHPLEVSGAAPTNGLSLEMFNVLEERVTVLEQLLKINIPMSVISSDIDDNLTKNAVINFDITDNSNSFDELPDPWLQKTTSVSPEEGSQVDNSLDNNTKVLNLLPPSTTTQASKELQGVPSKFNLLTSIELRQVTRMTKSQIDPQKRKVLNKWKKLGQSPIKKKLLKSPEKLQMKQPIIIDSCSYTLLYMGQNEKGDDLWSLIPSSDEHYQQSLSAQLSLDEISNKTGNKSFHIDPKPDNA